MFLRILRKDLRRKKTMNFILLLFIILATLFLASSVDNLIVVNGAIDSFIEISKAPDFFSLALTDGVTDEIADFLAVSEYVSEYEVIDNFSLQNEDITITRCQENPSETRYERTNTLCLESIPENFMKVFDEDGSEVILKPGEIAFSRYEAQRNHLQAGDRVRIRVGEVEKSFEIAAVVKDAVLGSSMMGFKRIFVSQEEFREYQKQEGLTHVRIYSVNYTDKEAFQKAWQKQNFTVISTIEDKSVIRMCYIMDVLIAAILIVVSVCLILIAFLVLRFTIVFTLQEDYREIGIMKAIGIRDRGIKGVYLVKYLALSVAGAAIGMALSIPFGKALLDRAIVNLVVEQTEQNQLVKMICAAGVILIVLGFCYLSTDKLRRISAIEAVRGGSDGERYRSGIRLKLRKRPHIKPYFYMAVNDILSSKKRFGILFVIFCLGTMLILLPLSASGTLKSDSIISSFSICPSDAYVDTGRGELYTVDMERMLEDMAEIGDKLAEAGITAKTGVDMGYMIPSYADDPEKMFTYYTLQAMGDWERSYSLLSGREPVLANEILITELTAEELGVGIGDTIHFKTGENIQEFIITGTFQSMMNMGKGYRVSRSAVLNQDYASGIICLQVQAENAESEKVREKLADFFPEYKVMDAEEFLNDIIGGVIEQIDTLTVFIMGVVLIINSLITILMMKTIMTKEHGSIALLKSMGFSDGSLRAWQTARILLVLVAAVAAGTVLSNLLAPFIIGPIFAMMGGTSMELVVNTLEVYVYYPALLLGITGIPAAVCAGGVKKVEMREVNTGE